MNRYICIHGHFYQPPRENPWLEDVELQDSAYPYHDWNQKITEECYEQNTSSRILDHEKKIIDIVNNYKKISFDFGPTLMRWLQNHRSDVYQKILDADKEGAKLFDGHGPAIAQCYNHTIMPLTNTRDKHTQVIWGIKDFEDKFDRFPEGMWLPETAVDNESLEVLAAQGIKFTILAPHQALKFRKIGEKKWHSLEKNQIDTTRAYLCNLPSGNKINLFFYQGPVSKEVAYGSALNSGDDLANGIINTLPKDNDTPQLAHIATDGETYGHHHRYGDMALAYCIHHIESKNLAKITVYGQFLEKFPPAHEVQIKENTSWSCPHGVGRWKENCRCAQDHHFAGKQQWRQPLRQALDWLREKLIEIYEEKMSPFTSDLLVARNRYIEIINDRSGENIKKTLNEITQKDLTDEQIVTLLKLLELQRNAMLMYTSCGWFFDSISGIETLQIILYASRAIQLAKEISQIDLENDFLNMLGQAPSNFPQFQNGKDIYEKLVKPNQIDLNRVAAHIAISSAFGDQPTNDDIYCYSVKIHQFNHFKAGIEKLIVARAQIQSKITLEKNFVDFAVLHLGGTNLTAAVSGQRPDDQFDQLKKDLSIPFKKGDFTEVMRIMNIAFQGIHYSLWHLFKDLQRQIVYSLLGSTLNEIEASYRHIYEYNHSIMQLMTSMNIPLPDTLATPAKFVINQDICSTIEAQKIDFDRLKNLIEITQQLSLKIDETKIKFLASRKITTLMKQLEISPQNTQLLDNIDNLIDLLSKVVPHLDLEETQNIFFAVSKKLYASMSQKAKTGDSQAKNRLAAFQKLGNCLQIKIS